MNKSRVQNKKPGTYSGFWVEDRARTGDLQSHILAL